MGLVEVRRGFTPSECDDMELWVIADMLADGAEPQDDGSPVIPSGFGASLGEDAEVLTEAEFAAESRRLIEERLRQHAASQAGDTDGPA